MAAPRLKKSEEFPSKYLEYAKVFLLDAYSDKAYGGTGQLADWNKFVNLKKQFSEHQWFLAGGLGPSNLLEALVSVCPDGIDLNSGVESEPGLKDNHKISEAFSILKTSNKQKNLNLFKLFGQFSELFGSMPSKSGNPPPPMPPPPNAFISCFIFPPFIFRIIFNEKNCLINRFTSRICTPAPSAILFFGIRQ